jgi:hypothetical protein
MRAQNVRRTRNLLGGGSGYFQDANTAKNRRALGKAGSCKLDPQGVRIDWVAGTKLSKNVRDFFVKQGIWGCKIVGKKPMSALTAEQRIELGRRAGCPY